MFIDLLGYKIHYQKEGQGKNVIFIHGWGQDLNCFKYLTDNLKSNYTVYSIDLPGFGQSEIPRTIFNTEDYSTIILEFIKVLKIKSPTLVGHSFGGKVIVDLVSKLDYHPNKIILIDSAGIKPKKSLIQKFNLYRYKFLKKVILKLYSKEKASLLISSLQKEIGSSDYNNAKGIMRDILVTVVNEDYKNSLNLIKTPTLLLWGENDTASPLDMAKTFNKEISNSGLVIIKSSNHFPFLDHPYESLVIIDNFLSN